MMEAAQRDRVLVRNPASHGPRLREPKMVSLAGRATTDGAWLFADEAQMIFVTTAARLHGSDTGCRYEPHR